ncbi:outer membrane protein OmpW [Gammaproteobacteria bacterium ESL0073]|uniref:Outer membrane protein OmpW n=1 Tax=Entomomonas moraniae TaxID=2213226 RepID=A0A3Q9JKY4_9GAMM|nr:OmpW family outer membrane protein [Entomomonas moraniae]AWM81365.1 outer membrane protein OmpW [Gammaproteobacteria bacterium ESL0073]AZS51801.1 outer membrane protein OmpW [Entomomonas moraniae]
MKKSILATSLLAITLAAPMVHAHKTGDIIIRAGAVTVSPHEHSSSIKGDRGAAAGANLGGKATLDSDTQLGLNFAYMFTDHLGVELLGATPFTHNVRVKGTSVAAANGKLGKVSHLPPTLSVVYYPADPTQAFQPYVGVGVNYTWFFNEKLSNSAKDGGAEFQNFRVRNTWGWAAQFGADYMITDKLMLNAQVRYINIDTRATVYSRALATRVKVDLDVNPWVYMVGIGYKFSL